MDVVIGLLHTPQVTPLARAGDNIGRSSDSRLKCLRSLPARYVGEHKGSGLIIGSPLTAAGTVGDFHPIPIFTICAYAQMTPIEASYEV